MGIASLPSRPLQSLDGAAAIGAMAKHGSMTSKVPPAWRDGDRAYTFRELSPDIVLWCISCAITADKQAGTIIGQLSGNARKVAKSIDPSVLQNGGLYNMNDGRGTKYYSGVTILMHSLANAFAPLDVEVSVHIIQELLTYRRTPAESIDSALSRFELLLARAHALGGFMFGPSGAAWYLLHALGIPKLMWVIYLQPFNGNVPTDENEFTHLLAYICRQGHVFEEGGIGARGLPATLSAGAGSSFMTGAADPLQSKDPWSSGVSAGGFMNGMSGEASSSTVPTVSPSTANPWIPG